MCLYLSQIAYFVQYYQDSNNKTFMCEQESSTFKTYLKSNRLTSLRLLRGVVLEWSEGSSQSRRVWENEEDEHVGGKEEETLLLALLTAAAGLVQAAEV